ncbi:MAG: hypothetical protein IRZ18_09465 [Clostridia bacterium]|nr:hypothetical protein [Clostridia bacterium]
MSDMTATGVQGSNPYATSGSVATGDTGRVADRLASLGKDTFMSLLVAQLKYQNPMSPMNNMDFVNQLAMFSMIEQLQAIREDLDQIRQAQSGTTPAQGATSGPGGQPPASEGATAP